MNIKTTSIIVITCLLVSTNSGAGTAKQDSELQIYLLREVTIDSETPNLGQVGIVRGEGSLVAKADKITLGQISLPGQKITLDRHTILSRLACNGISSSKVVLTGAEEVVVMREHQVIRGSRFVETALSFMKKNPPDDSVCGFSPMRIPEDLVLPGLSQDFNLAPCFGKSSDRNLVKVRVAVFSGGEEVGMREVIFRLKYTVSRAVTVVDIPRGGVINTENMKVEETTSNYPEPDNWAAPYGLIAKRRLRPNTVIRPEMVGYPEPPVLLKRNQNVVIKIDRLGLLVTANGKAVQDGKVGECIRVQNVDSQRIIMAKVNEDGTVEPVF
jgi:flagella basal body P-ring formation protein FlgA